MHSGQKRSAQTFLNNQLIPANEMCAKKIEEIMLISNMKNSEYVKHQKCAAFVFCSIRGKLMTRPGVASSLFLILCHVQVLSLSSSSTILSLL